MRRLAVSALAVFAAIAAPAAGHGGIGLTSVSGGGLSAQLTGSTLPGDQSPDGRERVDYTVQLRAHGRAVTDADVTLAVDRGDRIERRRANVVDGAFEVLVIPEDANWRRWPTRLTVKRQGTTLSAMYQPPDSSAPSWLPFLGVLLVPLLIFAGSRILRRHREAAD